MEKRKHVLDLLYQAKIQYEESYLILSMPGFITKKFRCYCSMREDLLLSSKYLDRIINEQDKIMLSALNYSLIALYGKCFTDATQNKSPKLERSIIVGNELLSTHDYLMELRHKFIAHRGDTVNEVGIAVMLFEKNGTRTQIQYKQVKRMSLSTERLKEARNLIDFLIKYVEQKIQETAQKAHDGYLDMFTPEQLSLLSINNINFE